MGLYACLDSFLAAHYKNPGDHDARGSIPAEAVSSGGQKALFVAIGYPYTILLCVRLRGDIMAPRGGPRPGAGRKPGSNDYGESTRAIRIPESLNPEIQSLLADLKAQRKQGIAPEGALLPVPSAVKQAFTLYSSRVPAGFPSPADDYVDQRLDLNDLVPSAIATRMLLALSDNASPISANLTGSSTASVAGTVVT